MERITVICKDDKGFRNIKNGEEYKVENSTRDFYYIRNERGVLKRYGKNRFAIKEEKPKKKTTVIEKKIEEPIPKTVICKVPSLNKLAYNKKYTVKKATDTHFELEGVDGIFVKSRFSY